MDVHRGRGEAEDGFDTITVDGTELEVYCDMTSDGGGCTLLVRSESEGGTWDDDTVLAAAERGLSKYHERLLDPAVCELDEE